jgi:hypothetical protein
VAAEHCPRVVDHALILGATGTMLGLGSLAYAHTQAKSARLQADSARQTAVIHLNRELTQSVLEARDELRTNANFREAHIAANPDLNAVYTAVGGIETALAMRNLLDRVHDVYHLRKSGIVEDHYWRNWAGTMPPFARMDAMQALVASGTKRGVYDEDFARAFAAARDGKPLADPLRES